MAQIITIEEYKSTHPIEVTEDYANANPDEMKRRANISAQKEATKKSWWQTQMEHLDAVPMWAIIAGGLVVVGILSVPRRKR